MLQTPSTRAATRRPGSSRQAKLLPTDRRDDIPGTGGQDSPFAVFLMSVVSLRLAYFVGWLYMNSTKHRRCGPLRQQRNRT